MVCGLCRRPITMSLGMTCRGINLFPQCALRVPPEHRYKTYNNDTLVQNIRCFTVISELWTLALLWQRGQNVLKLAFTAGIWRIWAVAMTYMCTLLVQLEWELCPYLQQVFLVGLGLSQGCAFHSRHFDVMSSWLRSYLFGYAWSRSTSSWIHSSYIYLYSLF